MNSPSYFEIQVDDLPRAIHFYEEIFAWQFKKAEGLPVEYWRIETDGGKGPRGGMMKRAVPGTAVGSGTNAFTCSMEVENFDAVAAKIEHLGGVVALPKFAVPGVCWQGYYVDPEHNVFGIFQPDPAAK